VVVYCGSASAFYTSPRRIASTFAAILERQTDAHLLAITPDGHAIGSALLNERVSPVSFTITHASADDVADLLPGGDVGLLLRDGSLTNRCAAPTKFGEYLASGIPVLISETLDDYARIVTDNDVGATLPHPFDGDAVNRALHTLRAAASKDGETYRQRCSDVARRTLSWEVLGTRLLGLYKTVCGSAVASE
jgi:glycosyltransferase involved in cell wall biosynthesis